MNMNAIVRSPFFWIISIILSLLCISGAVYFFPKSFPIVNLTITMNRSDALTQAADIMRAQNLGPKEYQDAVSFDTDTTVKTFVELENGKDALTEMLNKHFYEIYYWSVRHFKEHEAREAFVYFAPNGDRYGFSEILSQDEPGASLSTAQAQELAENMAQQWNINLSVYKQVETSQEVMPGGRTDHTFVYERTDITAGEGLYRLKVEVKGDKVSSLYPFVKIPESFNRRYEQMRSVNNTIAFTASFAMNILYVVIGCLFGLFILYRKNYVLFTPALKWGIVFGIITIFKQINTFPLYWMYYNTSIAMTNYILQFVIKTILSGTYTFGAVTLFFAAAEGLTRRAFGSHIQFNQSWNIDVARSISIAGRTIGAYLLVAWELFFVIIFYLLTTKYLGWWTPSESLIEPNILATYLPFINPLSSALFAGFIEECLFRAIPLAGAALLGRALNREKLFIGIAFIVQILIFSAAHANYPMQPAYARVVELILPSCTFGGLYLFFGLLPAIIMHVIYDAILMSLPIFVSDATGIWMQQAIVVIVCLLPIWIILFARYKGGAWHELASSYYNRAWQAIERQQQTIAQSFIPTTTQLNKKALAGIIAGTLAFAAVVIGIRSASFTQYALPLTISRTQALTIARNHFAQAGVTLDAQWTPLIAAASSTDNNTYEHRFIWQEGSSDLYTQLSSAYYLTPPAWSVRFVQFEGDIVERAREYSMLIAQDGTILQTIYRLPESDPGATLPQNEARSIAHNALTSTLHLNPQELTEISATVEQHPARKDWAFVFSNPNVYPLSKGQARILIKIAGDKVVQINRYIFVPEEWTRKENNKEMMLYTIGSIANIILMALFIGAIIIAILAYAHGIGSISIALWSALIFALLQVINIANTIPEYTIGFSTSQSFSSQLFNLISASSIGLILMIGSISIMIGYMYTMHYHHTIRDFISNYFYSGYILGACAFIIVKTIEYCGQLYNPVWAKFYHVDAYIPIYSIAVSTIFAFIYRIITFYSITALANYISQNGTRNIGLLISTFGIISFAIGANLFNNNLLAMISTSIFFGAFIFIAYYYFVRFDIRIIPLAVGSFIALSTLEQAWFNAFVHARIIFLCISICIVIISYFWSKKLVCQTTLHNNIQP